MTGASSKIKELLKKNGEMSLEDISKVYDDCIKTTRGKIAQEGLHLGVSLPIMVPGFTGIDSAKAFLSNGDKSYNEDEFREQLLKEAKTQEERVRISAMNSFELKAEFVKRNFQAQLEGMMTIEGVGLALRRFQAARLAGQAVPKPVNNLLGAKIKTVEKDGKPLYEVVQENGKTLKFDMNDGKTVSKFSSPERAIAAYQAMCVKIVSEFKAELEKADNVSQPNPSQQGAKEQGEVRKSEVNSRLENSNSLDKKLIDKALNNNSELANSLLSIKDKDGNYIFSAQDVEWFTDSKGVDLYNALKDTYGEENLKYYKEEIDVLIKENPNAETILKVLSDIRTKYPNGNEDITVEISGLTNLTKFVTPNNIEKVVQNLKARDRKFGCYDVQNFVKDILEQSMVECEKQFSPTERAVIKDEIANHPEKQEAFEKMLQNPDVSEKQMVEILKSKKISIEDLKNIDSHIKTAKEQGFDLINLLESKEEDFNNYINTESARIERGIPAQRTSNGFKVTDNPKELAKQLKFVENVSSSTLEKISKLSKDETKTISQIFASEGVLKKLNYDNLNFVINNYKNAKPEDIKLIQQGIEAGACVYGDNKVKLFLDAAGDNASKREVVSMLFKNIAEFEKNSLRYNYIANLFNENHAMLKILNDINTPEQVEALKYYFENAPLKKMNVSHNYIPDFTKITTVNDVKDMLKLQNYTCSYEFNKLYMSLSAEDRALFTKEQFDNANYYGKAGYYTYTDIIKTLLDPKLDEVTKNDIREFLKTNPSENKQYEWDKCFENIDGVRTLIPETLRRFTALDKTGVKYDQSEYEHFAYRTTKDGKAEYLYSTELLNKIIDILNNPNIKEKLGRMLTMYEAEAVSYIKQDWQLNFVIENLAKDMRESDVENLCREIRQARIPEQLPLVKLALKYDYKFPTKDSEIVKWDQNIYNHLTTKESVEAFEKIFERNDYTTNEAKFLRNLAETCDGNTFALKYELMNKTGNLKSNINNDYYNYFIEHTENEFQAKFLEEAGVFLEKHPEFKEHFEAIVTYLGNISFYKNINSKEVLTTILNNLKKIEKSDFKYISEIVRPKSLFMGEKDFADLLLSSFSNEKIDFIKSLKIKDGWDKGSLPSILCSDVDIETLKLIKNKSEQIYEIATTAEYINNKNIKLARLLLNDKDVKLNDIDDLLRDPFNRMSKETFDARCDVYKSLKNGIEKKDIIEILQVTDADNSQYAIDLCLNYKKYDIAPQHLSILIEKYNEITVEQYKTLEQKVGKTELANWKANDIVIGSQLSGLIGNENINEIPLSQKRSILKTLVSCNTNLFGISEKLKEKAPLIPRNQEEYCELLPSLVRSLGVETNKLSAEQITHTNKATQNLSKSLAKLSDSDFAKLSISQEYSREDFINTVLEKTKDLPEIERQKVFDYYGFELLKNDTNKTGYTLYGYPVNLNNGHKLAEINDVNTKAVVENLRNDVVKFSKNNRVKCENPQVEQFLNEIVEVLPEIRTMIGKAQHGNNGTRGAHDYDVMKHSLKVMQKISQDPKFAKLSESYKKVMLLASLMHDITKAEGHPDGYHAENGAFDVFFISKKFNLTSEEETKLYKICKYHEWLNFVNTSRSESELTERLQSVAFDLQQDNLVDMAEIFTHADLRAVKADDSFHDTKIGKSRVDFNGNVRSFGESADVYVARIKEYQKELQKSQPILPVTKFPQASRMKQAITKVNADGSTNLKGVYQDKDGVVVIKFNEMTDESWEAIGFPKGTSAKGVNAKGLNNNGAETDVETGNIHFFVHGLDYSNQLAKFDAFSLVDSDALLSVSYAERPESKYRFFRTQGVLLDIPTKYVYGGGNTDSGSGCGKNIQEFKNNYIFGGERESDRLYISNLVKEATDMSDAEYVQFVKENENKSMLEIEPAEIREKIIQKFATINSNVRKGNREYNEMYGSNPQVMGVFAYSWESEVGQPIDFLNNVDNRTHFLKEYAKERDLPFIVFGD